MVRLVEKIPDTGRDDVGMDDAVMMFFLGLVVFDHVRHRLWIVRNVFTDGNGSPRPKYKPADPQKPAARPPLHGTNPAERRSDPPGPLARVCAESVTSL